MHPKWRYFWYTYSSLNLNLRLEKRKRKKKENLPDVRLRRKELQKHIIPKWQHFFFVYCQCSLSNDRLAEFCKKASPSSSFLKVNLPWLGKINLSRALLALSRGWFREAHSIPRNATWRREVSLLGRDAWCVGEIGSSPPPWEGKILREEQGWRNAKVFLVLFIYLFFCLYVLRVESPRR